MSNDKIFADGFIALTQSTLKESLHYDPDTGEFTWAKPCGVRGIVGQSAGSWRNGYIMIQVSHQKHFAHRLAFLYMVGRMPCGPMDHINGVKDDNRWENLREVSHTENMRNRVLDCRVSHGVHGVWLRADTGKWRASINVDSRRISLGTYEHFFDAVCARKSAEIAHGFHPLHGRPQ